MKTTTGFAMMTAALAFGALAPDAQAKNRRVERFEMVAPVRSPDAEATGVVRVKQLRNGAKTTIRMRHLTAHASYEVRDADSGIVLGTVTANKRGKARLKLRHRDDRGKAATEAGPTAVAVYREDADPVVLLGNDDEAAAANPWETVALGDEAYGSILGPNATVSLFDDGDGHGQFSIFLDVRTDASGRSHYSLVADTIIGDTLPAGATGVVEFAGAAFAIVDGLDNEVLAGTFPELHSFADLLTADWLVTPLPLGDAADDVTFTPPFTLAAALDGLAFEDLGELAPMLETDDAGFLGDSTYGSLSFGQYGDVNGSITLSGDSVGGCLIVAFWVPGEDDQTMHSYDASTFAGEGSLPVGADSLVDLIGRRLQIRDALGNVMVERDIPEFDAGDDWLPEADIDGAAIVAGPPPYAIWVENDGGSMIDSGAMTATELNGGGGSGYGGGWGWFPDDYLAGGAFYGSYFGTYGSLSLSSIGQNYETFLFQIWVSDGTFFGGDLYQYDGTHDAAYDSLPFGVESVSELVGRAFQVRNANGEAFISDVIPDLEEPDYDSDEFPFEYDDELVTGPAPFKLFMEDADGVLTEIAEIEQFGSGGF